MSQIALSSIIVIVVVAAPARAQAPWQFGWRAGDTLNYRVKHSTKVSEVLEGSVTETRSNLEVIKRWQVADVDGQGVATLHLSLTAMRNEQVRPNGETLLFDSNDLDKSTPELREMAKFLGKTLAILRVDRFGRVHDVKHGDPSKYESEPPFVLVLPSVAPKAGQAWLRSFNVTLDPPHGAGEKHPAEQRFTCTKLEDGTATVSLATSFKKLPETAGDRLPLLQKMTNGTVTFDVQAGRMTRAEIHIDQKIENHQGAGSSYRLVSDSTEELLGRR